MTFSNWFCMVPRIPSRPWAPIKIFCSKEISFVWFSGSYVVISFLSLQKKIPMKDLMEVKVFYCHHFSWNNSNLLKYFLITGWVQTVLRIFSPLDHAQFVHRYSHFIPVLAVERYEKISLERIYQISYNFFKFIRIYFSFIDVEIFIKSLKIMCFK